MGSNYFQTIKGHHKLFENHQDDGFKTIGEEKEKNVQK